MNFLEKISRDSFLKNNIIFFIGSMAVSFLNYIYNPILARIMNIEDWGEVQILNSLFMQISIILGVFGIIVVNIVSNEKNSEKKVKILSQLRKSALIINVTILGLIIVCSQSLQSFFQFHSFFPFISLGVLTILGVDQTFRMAYLQGVHDFKWISITNIINALGKIFFSVVLILLGWKTFGAINGLIIAQILSFWVVYKKSKNGIHFIHPWKMKIDKSMLKEVQYGLVVGITSLTITFFCTFDVLLVKHFFTPIDAGLYSGVALIARIIYFITIPMSAVLLPAIKIENSKKTNTKLLFKSLAIIMLMGGVSGGLFIVFPNFIIQLLVGKTYLFYAYLLPKLTIIFFLISLINAGFYYYIALRRYFIGIIASSGIITVSFLSYIRHNMIQDILNNFFVGITIMILFFISYISFNKLKRIWNSKKVYQ